MTERESFEQAIAENPRDETTHKVFADWLDEHDEPELADFHRSWTLVRYDEAWEYLREFAAFLNKSGADYNDGRDLELTADVMLDAMEKQLETERVHLFLGFDTPDRCWDEKNKLWEAFEVIKSRKVLADAK